MILEEHALRLGQGGGEIGRHQLAEAFAADNAVRVGAVRRLDFVGEPRPDALPGGFDGARIDVLFTNGGDGLLETLFGLHDASPMRLVISLRKR